MAEKKARGVDSRVVVHAFHVLAAALIPTRQAMVMASEPDIAALMAKQRFEDEEHGERALTPAIFLFDGEGPLVPLIPQIPERALH